MRVILHTFLYKAIEFAKCISFGSVRYIYIYSHYLRYINNKWRLVVFDSKNVCYSGLDVFKV